ncbi:MULTISPECIES: PQQ-binding-like beta-propeller repeat protein [unclassified Salinibacterium]|uniref:outer membrane protein assembly factor BamB family protein n=1 Tax=unclassified Salinibacterium TaxID=2632331 RepID=UPI0014243C15|nr:MULTISPECIES: PQQ-binding-like beta-propeller repeat protein [unclassified Salinibacterium]
MATTPAFISRVLLGTALILGLSGCTAPAPAAVEDFSAALGTLRECVAASDGEATPGTLVWTVDLGSESWSTPVVVGSTAYLGADDGVLRAVNTATGTVEWKFVTEGAIRSEPLHVDDALYVVSDDGFVYAVGLDGKLLWSAEIGANDRAGDFSNYGSRAEAAGSLLVVAGGNGVVHALERSSGEPRWTFDTEGPIQANIAVGGGRAYVASDVGRIFSLDLATGEESWSLSTGLPATTHPAYSDGVVVVGSRSTRLLALDAATGDELWNKQYGTSWVQSGATIVDGVIITGSSDIGEVRAYTIASGEAAWRVTIGGWAWGTPVECDGAVYMTSMRPERMQPWDVAVHALATADGALMWEAGTGEARDWHPDGLAMYGAGASAAVAPGVIVVPGLDGVLYGFQR